MFQIGDYVEVDFTKFYDIPPGLTTDKLGGEVICGGSEYGSIGIQFFEYVGGHNCSGKGRHGFCWWVDGCYIKKTKSKNIFIKSLNIEVYMKNKRYYYADTNKEVTDLNSLKKIFSET